MFCKYCGKNIDDDSMFCDGCGRRLKGETVETVYVPEPVADSEYKNIPVAEESPQPYQQPVIVNPAPAQNAEIPDTPLTKKKSIVPYILLPIAVLIGAFINTVTPLLFGYLNGELSQVLIDLGYKGLFVTSVSNFLSIASGILPTLVVLALFSLCCKGLNRKFRFISSFYAAGVGKIIATLVCVIAGYIILYVEGFHEIESANIYATVILICSLLCVVIIYPLLSLMWFSLSEKYVVRKDKKNQPIKIILPCIFLGLYGLIVLGLTTVNGAINISLQRLFGEYSVSFSLQVANLITTSISLVCLFLFALSCKGGYRKLSFIGSVFFSKAFFAAVGTAVSVPFTLINDVSTYALGAWVGNFVQVFLIIALSIVLYILMNRYSVEKIQKIK